MSPRDEGRDHGLDDFERALRERAARPPRRSGAEAAAAVRARLGGAAPGRRALRSGLGVGPGGEPARSRACCWWRA